MNGNFARVSLCSGTRSVDFGSYSSIETDWAAAMETSDKASGIIERIGDERSEDGRDFMMTRRVGSNDERCVRGGGGCGWAWVDSRLTRHPGKRIWRCKKRVLDWISPSNAFTVPI